MGTIVKYGLLLGILIVLWTFIMGFTGWYKDPVLLNLFWVVLLLEIWIVLTALQSTARLGMGYRDQIIVALAVATTAGLLVFAGSLLFTTVAFPKYFEELRAAQENVLRRSGLSEAEIAEQIESMKSQYTPFRQALQGFIGTVVSSLLIAAIGAVWIRKRPSV